MKFIEVTERYIKSNYMIDVEDDWHVKKDKTYINVNHILDFGKSSDGSYLRTTILYGDQPYVIQVKEDYETIKELIKQLNEQ